MTVKLNEIKNLMIKKETLLPSDDFQTRDIANAINEAIDQQGQVKIGINREKLAEVLSISVYGPMAKDDCLKLADAIIAREAELLEVKNETD